MDCRLVMQMDGRGGGEVMASRHRVRAKTTQILHVKNARV